jgi:type IV pilus assembly protein PilA
MLKRIREMKDQDGFTLIELMVVVLIIAILIAIAIPTFLGLRSRAQNRSAQSDLRNGLTAAKAFYTDSETFTGFDATAAEAVEPSLTWGAAGSKTTVGIAVAAADDVVLTKQSESDDWFCAMDDNGLSSVRGPAATEALANTVALCGGLPVV